MHSSFIRSGLPKGAHNRTLLPVNGERMTLGQAGWVDFVPDFVEENRKWLETLCEELPLKQETLRLFGRDIPMPRLTSWHGDPNCSYRYSRRTFLPSAWTPHLTRLRTRLEERENVPFNSVLANYYRDGSDSMGKHADDEPELGPSREDIRVASISLGARRTFILRHRESGQTHRWQLGEGSLLVMGGTVQTHYVHHIPKTKKTVGPRLNLTFRVILPQKKNQS